MPADPTPAPLAQDNIPNHTVLLSVADACKAAGGISRSQLFKETASGRLASRKIGKRRVISVDALRAWANALPVG